MEKFLNDFFQRNHMRMKGCFLNIYIVYEIYVK